MDSHKQKKLFKSNHENTTFIYIVHPVPMFTMWSMRPTWLICSEMIISMAFYTSSIDRSQSYLGLWQDLSVSIPVDTRRLIDTETKSCVCWDLPSQRGMLRDAIDIIISEQIDVILVTCKIPTRSIIGT